MKLLSSLILVSMFALASCASMHKSDCCKDSKNCDGKSCELKKGEGKKSCCS